MLYLRLSFSSESMMVKDFTSFDEVEGPKSDDGLGWTQSR